MGYGQKINRRASRENDQQSGKPEREMEEFPLVGFKMLGVVTSGFLPCLPFEILNLKIVEVYEVVRVPHIP